MQDCSHFMPIANATLKTIRCFDHISFVFRILFICSLISLVVMISNKKNETENEPKTNSNKINEYKI